MGDGTAIQWADSTWNPVVGCSIKSKGCIRCYAMRDAWRKNSNPKLPRYHGLTKLVNGSPVFTGKVASAPDKTWEDPIRWSRPRRIFVNSMGDLFHEEIPEAWIDRAFLNMAIAAQHQFLILTKRPERQRDYTIKIEEESQSSTVARFAAASVFLAERLFKIDAITYPAPNIWCGTSVEDQPAADERMPHLVETLAAIRYVSVEPMLGPVDLSRWLPDIDWVIIGGESGPRARRFRLEWARDLIAQCRRAGVHVFMKQLGSYASDRGVMLSLADRKGGDMNEWPEDLRIREWPR